ncbi:hypothetical protein [Priestia megaterium]|uniref:hypothetical protein n=1 Tax=Priestia megaterium TaxID=1404 RepID=UPI0028774B7E|nr:hypothetical protein [Priestia megaterium]
MSKKKTTEEFRKEVFKITNDEYLVIGQYKNALTHVKIMHNVCKHEWDVKPSNFLNGTRCPKCYGNIKKTTKEFIKEVHDLVNNEYEVVGDYTNNQTKLLIRHNICKTEWNILPNAFLRGNRCPTCSGKKKKDTVTFKKEVYKLVADEYYVLGEYEHNKKKILMKHNKCSHLWKVAPLNFINGTRCPLCFKNNRGINLRFTHSDFENQINAIYKDEYTLLSDYLKMSEDILVRHNSERCKNYQFYIKPYSLKQGHGCPVCKSSKGERKIISLLNKLNIKYDYQFKFKDCRNELPLPFDFKVKNVLIEYDGEQHFKAATFFGGEESFKRRRNNDEIKNEFCTKNAITLFRIPYWKFDKLEDIVLNILSQFELAKTDETNLTHLDISEYVVNNKWDHTEYIEREGFAT